MRKIILIFFFIGLISNTFCQNKKEESTKNQYLSKSIKLSDNDLKFWYHKDYEKDTIPGIGLEKLYNSNLLGKDTKKVIVAVLDTKLDIHHEDLSNQIWKNHDEIPNNGIDDDNNGYIDDINGWDFLSNKKGEYVKYQNYETVRFLKKYSKKFETRDTSLLNNKEKEIWQLYKKAKKLYKEKVREYKSYIEESNFWLKKYREADPVVKKVLNKKSYHLSDLDSLLKKRKDSLLKSYIDFLKASIEYQITPKIYQDFKSDIENTLRTSLNLDFDERRFIGDDPADISDVNYGYNQVYGNVPFQHSTSVTGVLAATRSNNRGIKGFFDNILIMPIVMVASGDEYDKDVALAIRYAVDNGAKVINMSWGKKMSLNEEWVREAIKYASEHDVLLVTGAGNDSKNIDKETSYPTDVHEGKEFVDNFIAVGASTYFINQNLIASFSNYGKENVDIFAPGSSIYTTSVNNQYEFSRGTSLSAPLVSGLAALLRSHFPDFSANQIKRIIMESGNTYTLPVVIKSGENKKEKISFNQLSKSGKIINAYNAFVTAEKKYKTRHNKN